MALRTVTLQGKYQTLAGDPAVGTVSFELSGPLLDSAGNVIYPSLKRVERLDETGAFNVVLPATKGDSSTAPQGLTYKINEAISPGPAHVYAIELDADLGTTQQLADIAPATNVTVQTYALVSTLAAHTAASTNVHGIVDTSQLATLADVAANVPEWGNVSGTLSAQTDLSTALAAKQDALGFTPLAPANNLSDVASAATALDNLTLTQQLDLPSQTLSCTRVVKTINGTNVATNSINLVILTYTIPVCIYAVLRLAHLHIDFLTSTSVSIIGQTLVTAGLEPPYLLQYLEAITDHELNAAIIPAMVLHTGDVIQTLATNTDSLKVVDATYVVEIYD